MNPDIVFHRLEVLREAGLSGHVILYYHNRRLIKYKVEAVGDEEHSWPLSEKGGDKINKPKLGRTD